MYLVQGKLVAGSPIVDNGDGTTTIQYELVFPQPLSPWDNPARWGSKGGFSDPSSATDGSRGLIFATKNPLDAQLYEVIAADVTTITLKGHTTYLGDVGLSPAASFGLIYGQLIKDTMDDVDSHGQGAKNIKFFSPLPNPTGSGGFVDNTPATSSPGGICQVCHPATVAHWNTNNSGDGPTAHYPEQNCLDCHPHTEGLKSFIAPTFTLHSSASNGYISGGEMYLWWEVTDAVTAEIDNGIGPVEPVDPAYQDQGLGYIIITPTVSAKYTITVTNAEGIPATSSVIVI